MNDSVLITTPIPTPEELARQLGVSRAHLNELRAIVRETRPSKGIRSKAGKPSTAKRVAAASHKNSSRRKTTRG